MENIKMSFVSLQRLLNIASKLLESEGEITKFECNTLKYLIEQCNEEQQTFLKNKYSQQLAFLFAE